MFHLIIKIWRLWITVYWLRCFWRRNFSKHINHTDVINMKYTLWNSRNIEIYSELKQIYSLTFTSIISSLTQASQLVGLKGPYALNFMTVFHRNARAIKQWSPIDAPMLESDLPIIKRPQLCQAHIWWPRTLNSHQHHVPYPTENKCPSHICWLWLWSRKCAICICIKLFNSHNINMQICLQAEANVY